MNILGISAFYHDSAACLIRDGKIFAAAQEERFTRKKHDHRFQFGIKFPVVRTAPSFVNFIGFKFYLDLG